MIPCHHFLFAGMTLGVDLKQASNEFVVITKRPALDLLWELREQDESVDFVPSYPVFQHTNQKDRLRVAYLCNLL